MTVDMFFPPLPEPAKPEEPETGGWDSRPFTKVVGGVDVELFTIGAVCAALGRPIVTIRHWIREGHLPEATFRMPTRKMPNGGELKGRRMYTRGQIEAIIAVAQDHEILGIGRVDWSKHPTFCSDVKAAWKSLSQAQ